MKRNSLYIVLAVFVLLLTTSVMAKEGIRATTDVNKACDLKLMKSLDNERVEKRATAALKLAQNGCPIIQDKLIDMVENEERYAARIVAIVALTKIGDDNVVDVLKQRLLEEDRQTVKNVINGAINKMEKKQLASL